MQAIVLNSEGLRFDPSHSEPQPAEGETLVHVNLAGICETDLQLAQGYMGFSGIPGHEFVGVAQSGRFADHRVVSEINGYCQRCETCLAGRPTHCPHRTVIGIDRHDGGFAQRVAVPNHILHPIPDSMPDEAAVFVEPLAAAFQILEQVSIARRDRVAILGDGRLSFLSASVLSLHCDHLTVFGKHDPKLNRFAKLGVEGIRIDSFDAADFGQSFDVVVDCTGSTSGLPMAIQWVRPRGTIVMKTTVAQPHQLSLADIVIHEIRLVGSRCGPFPKAIAAIENGNVDVTGLITHRYPLDQVDEAFAAAIRPDAFKVVFDMD